MAISDTLDIPWLSPRLIARAKVREPKLPCKFSCSPLARMELIRPLSGLVFLFFVFRPAG